MLKLFISYSHKDREWCDRLHAHLAGIGKEVLAEVWYDRHIAPGSEWNSEIVKHLDEANIVIFLVSSNFVDADYCPLEVERAMKRQAAGECIVIPVILRHYNLTGSGYAHLQPSPQGGGPIDSASWPDKELAFTTVSNEIETHARARLGNATRHKPLPPDPRGFQKLLHHLCDRLPQRMALHGALGPDRRKDQRPFVIVVVGHQHDSLEWFLSRLEHVLLKTYFSRSVGRLSPLEWPKHVHGRRPLDSFESGLSDCLSVRPFASVEEMNAALTTMSPVSLLPTFLSGSTWSRKTEALFDAYLELWKNWPKMPSDRMLIPVVCVECHEEMSATHRLFRYLKKLDFNSMSEVGGVLLPQMDPVEHHEFNDWLRLDQVRSRIPEHENAIDQSNHISSKFPARMYHVADQYLPQLLQSL